MSIDWFGSLDNSKSQGPPSQTGIWSAARVAVALGAPLDEARRVRMQGRYRLFDPFSVWFCHIFEAFANLNNCRLSGLPSTESKRGLRMNLARLLRT